MRFCRTTGKRFSIPIRPTGAKVFLKESETAILRAAARVPQRSAVNPKDQKWVDEKMTPQPIGVSVQPLHLTGARDRVPKKAYVRARKYAQPDFDRWYNECAKDPTWKVFDLTCGHDAMIDVPQEVTEILIKMT